MPRKKNKPHPAGAPVEESPAVDLTQVVAAYAAQAKAAADLAEVDTAHLDTPTANPNALATLNAERDATARAKIQLDFERERLVARDAHQVLLDQIAQRRHRATAVTARSERAVAEGLADADEATAQLATIREFEAAASPAAAATALTRAVRGWRREEFVNAIVGSALSAVGIAALLVALTSLTWWTAPLVAAAAEVVLTMRVVRLISQRATLAERHKGQTLSREGKAALVFMGRQILVLLAVSVLVNLAGLVVATGWLGLIGVLGALAAAVSSWSAAKVSVAVTETVRSNVKEWQGSDWERAREELRTRAAGAHIPTPEDAPTAPARQEVDPAHIEQSESERLRSILAGLADEQIAALADRGTDALAAMLNRSQPPTEGGTAALAQGPHDPTGTPSEASGTPGGTHGFQGGSTTADQYEQPQPTGNCLRVLEAIRDPRNGLGSTVTNTALADQLDLSRTAVRKHRNWLKEHGYLPSDVTTTDQTDQ
ncbi:winged helix-turn-helix domain-containing protein [Nocardiopsis sp. NPDC050513]|uniref:winged helix-turn-helix domain-containing protein n=1 Tax=Nocardiopsis sp. NPDC050513 TaxID=3364338 RepID=UPI0037A15D31